MKTTVKLNAAGVKALLYSPGVRADLERRGTAITTKANATLTGEDDGYRMWSKPGQPRGTTGRWRVSVTAASIYARRSNAKYNTLLKLVASP